MEHNRWSAEMLMRNFQYVDKEETAWYRLDVRPGAPKRFRKPDYVHRRSTLKA